MKKTLLRGRCSLCGHHGCVRPDGLMWQHKCLQHRFARPAAIDVETFDYRVTAFVSAILPNATADELAAAILDVKRIMGEPPPADAVDPHDGSTPV